MTAAELVEIIGPLAAASGPPPWTPDDPAFVVAIHYWPEIETHLKRLAAMDSDAIYRWPL